MQRDPRRNPGKVAEAIRAARSIAVCCHVNPDGDAIGSSLSVKLGLVKLGKTVDAYCQDKVPDNLIFLPGAAEIMNAEQAAGKRYDLLLCVDTATADRMGRCMCLLDQCAESAQLDHHPTNPGYTSINDIDGNAGANCLLVYELLKELNVETDVDIAQCLYAGISTDTGNFAYKDTGAESFAVMSELMQLGLPLQDLNRRLHRERPLPQLYLTVRTINSLKFRCNGQLAVMTLTDRDFKECGALSEHADTMVNVGLDIPGVKMAVLGRETGEGTLKFSLRALAPFTVDQIAVSFGGGGHGQAAGITMTGELNETVSKVASVMEEALNGMNL